MRAAVAQRVLIVEDEQHLAEGVRFNLEAEGYEAQVVETGESALARILESGERYDLIVLDVMLPGIDGFQVATELRKRRQFVPVLMLTARGRPEDVLKGFDAGADDYLAKPAELPILLARIGSLLRRSEWSRRTTHERYEFGDTSIDFANLQLTVGSRVFPLTLMEANLLRYLVDHEGQAVSRKAMLEHVWGLREDTDTRAIDNFLVRLRRYIEKEPSHPRHLLTVRGVGYRFVREPEGLS
ncbi:MAG TPA: response regulator transcription factor [Vicinamibacterales bacterium]|jgi:DNA-binding response OmpR family regulator|nr:response regulator transcription factor [Vicinamibacterales bacterium]